MKVGRGLKLVGVERLAPGGVAAAGVKVGRGLKRLHDAVGRQGHGAAAGVKVGRGLKRPSAWNSPGARSRRPA